MSSMRCCLSHTVKAEDIMTTDVVCLNESLDLHECEKILLDRGISGAPVVDEKGRLLGVLSKTDIVNHHYCSGEAEGGGDDALTTESAAGCHVFEYSSPKAGALMTPVPCIASVHTSLVDLAALMVDHELHRVVICHNRKVVGIVSSFDIMRAVAGRPLAAMAQRAKSA